MKSIFSERRTGSGAAQGAGLAADRHPRWVTVAQACGLGIALAVLLVGAGCETTGLTTPETSRAEYQDARQFLQIGTTTKDQTKAKYGAPKSVTPLADGEMWRYQRVDTVVVNAYSGNDLGTEGAIMAGRRGFSKTIDRMTRMDLYFKPTGVLYHYRVVRDDAP